jgi:hypothetical protein
MGHITVLIFTIHLISQKCFPDILCGEFYPNQKKNSDTLQAFTAPQVGLHSLSEKFVLPGVTHQLDLSKQQCVNFSRVKMSLKLSDRGK